MQPTVFDFRTPSSAAKRRQLTCSVDDLAILSAFVRGKPGLQLGKLPPHSRLSIPVFRDTVGFTHGYPLTPHSRLSIAFPVGSKAQHDCLSHVEVFIRNGSLWSLLMTIPVGIHCKCCDAAVIRWLLTESRATNGFTASDRDLRVVLKYVRFNGPIGSFITASAARCLVRSGFRDKTDGCCCFQLRSNGGRSR